jgi:hypothetical protein
MAGNSKRNNGKRHVQVVNVIKDEINKFIIVQTVLETCRHLKSESRVE